MRVYLESFGCSQNQGEGAGIARDLASRGHELARDPASADVGVLVTCGVIGPTEGRMVRRWQALSARLPRVVVTGCLVPLRTDLMQGPGRDRTTFVPIREQDHLPALLDGWSSDFSPSLRQASADLVDRTPVSEEVIIAQGCTSGCTYCFSRLARGRLTSVPIPDVVARVRAAVGRGVREIRLTGLDTAAWGEDLPGPERLPDLLRAVEGTPGGFRIRVGMMSPQSLEPHLDDYLTALDQGPAYRFLHLPVQSGSNRVLKLMHRGYAREQYLSIVGKLRQVRPAIGLSTDFIVGFPGETEVDFEESLSLAREVEFDQAYIFKYSQRRDTPAANLPDQVPQKVREERNQRLLEVINEIAKRKYGTLVGRQMQILVEGPSKKNPARMTGRTRCNKIVVFDGSERHRGQLMDVKITRAGSFTLYGDPAILNL